MFCLLGHNGAGKTTTINMLTGLFPPSEGHITVFGKDIVDNLEDVRAMIGICPQHDILWNEMSPCEHLRLFSRLKDLDESVVEETVESTLKHVNLYLVRDHPVSSFSGGMKRRLSVAISSIGDPSVIFMDEPTTGMDPKSRRQVWGMIEDLKKDRVIIMTTHSMDEAEMLSDRVGIMARGALKCIGTSLYLKNTYGKGYRLSLLTAMDAKTVHEVKVLVAHCLPEVILQTESGGSLMYSLQNCEKEAILRFISLLERNGESSGNPQMDQVLSTIMDWGISQAGLEEVFLSVTGHGTANESNVIRYVPDRQV